MPESCAGYFKSNKAYKRLFIELRKKWKMYGRASGYIILKDAAAEEREALKLVMGKSYNEADIKIKMSDFEAALQETKFKGTGLQALLECYFNEDMITNKNVRLEKAEQKKKFFEEIIREISTKRHHDDVILWLENVMSEKKFGYNIIITEYEKSKNEVKIIIFNVCEAITRLKRLGHEKIRLAILGAEITANPHYFDRNNTAGKLLIYALSFINKISEPQDAEGKLELYYLSGVKPDDISSFTTLYGIRLYNEQGVHTAYESFMKENESYVVTLSNISKIVKADCKNRVVYVFENQMVFSYMCDALSGLPVSMLCTSGQMKTASVILIDLLCESGCVLYYSGDIDPEGISIADKIISRHPEHIIPWRMTVADYELCISDEELDDVRIKKLDKIKDKRFVNVVDKLREVRKAGYQELLIENLIADIKAKLTDFT